MLQPRDQYKQCDYTSNYLVVATCLCDLEQIAWPFCLRLIMCGTGITVPILHGVVLVRGSNTE